MVKSFENLDNILRDWVKDKVQKTIVEALNRYEKQKEERNYYDQQYGFRS